MPVAGCQTIVKMSVRLNENGFEALTGDEVNESMKSMKPGFEGGTPWKRSCYWR